MPIRNVIFDFGGVLVEWRPDEIIDAFYAEPELREAIRTHVFQHDDWTAMDRGEIDEFVAVQRFAARMARPEAEMHALLAYVRESLTPIASSVALLGELRQRAYTLYGLSNMPEPVFAHLQSRHDFFGLFDGIVVSAAVRLVKPDPAIYEHLRDRFEIDFAESVFIDDLPRNIESARRLGLAAIQFRSPEQVREELATLL